LDGVYDCNSADALKDMSIWVAADDVETEDDEYLWADLIACEVYVCDAQGDDADVCLGTVTSLEAYGAQDTLIVRTPPNAEKPGEWLLPFIEGVVQDVDLDLRRIRVTLPEGMDACFTPKS